MIPSGRAMSMLLDAIRRVESGGNPRAVSDAGAKGPYQLMDATGLDYHKKLKIDAEYNPFDETQSRLIAQAILSDYALIFDGDMARGILAYHSGPHNVKVGNIGPVGKAYLGRVLGALFDFINTRTEEVWS